MPNESKQEKRPKVSVAIITYNHEKYIEQAVRSVMMQETDFAYELVIGEDCSTDRTREIVLRLKEEFGDRIRLILHDKNVGMVPNFRIVLEHCVGEFTALLEGDDYWCDARKLRLQVEQLTRDTSLSMSFHSVVRAYDDEISTEIERPGVCMGRYTLDDYLQHFPTIATASIVFRTNQLSLPSWLDNISNLDSFIHIELAHAGNIGYLDPAMAVHIIHEGGIWSYLDRISKSKHTINTCIHLNVHYDYRYAKAFKIREQYAQLALKYARLGRRIDALRSIWLMIKCHNGHLPRYITCAKILVVFLPAMPHLLRWLKMWRRSPLNKWESNMIEMGRLSPWER